MVHCLAIKSQDGLMIGKIYLSWIKYAEKFAGG